MLSLQSRILEIFSGSCTVEESADIKVFAKKYFPKLSSETLSKVDDIWHSALGTKTFFEDSVLYYLNHSTQFGRCSIVAFWGSYKFFYARCVDPQLDIPFTPLSVSGICSLNDNKLLVGSRGEVAEYRNALEFVPSGGISKSLIDFEEIDYTQQIVEEFETETGIDRNYISGIKTLGIVLDLEHSVVDVCCSLNLGLLFPLESINHTEYVSLRWLKMHEIEIDNLIPTSRSLLNLYRNSS